jgi:glyoxylate reductase
MKKIFVTNPIPEVGMELLREKYKLVKKPEGVDAVVSLLTFKIDGAFMDRVGGQLKVIGNYAVGFNNIDLVAAKKRGIMVTNTPGVLTDTVAEHTIALLMAIARRIPESDKFVRAGKYKGWEPMLLLGSDLKGKTLGIIGFGRIGQRVREIAEKGLEMKVLYYDKFSKSNASIKKILKESDFVTTHVPLLPSTRHLIGAKELKMMKSSAYLINTSRGPVIDESALVKALKRGDIRGAALDVFEDEPKLAKGLKSLKNVVLTPHTASGTRETRDKMAVMVANNVISALSGKKPANLVNINES